MRRSLVPALLGLALAGCGGGGETAAPPPLTDLAGVEELAAHFDDAAGQARVVLVFSPT